MNVLFLMLIPTLFLMFLIITKKDSFSKHFTNETLEKLSISNRYFSNKARNATLFLALIFMIIALARPVTNEKIYSSKQELNTLIIAIDVSKSMLATDIYPNRLEFARKKLLDIINQSKTSAIGVVLFAKSSFILSPLTQDFTSLNILIENLDTGANFDNGTNIYSTLEITNKLLKDYTNKNLLILSDGGDKDKFNDEIDYANKNNISVYTIGLASKNGAAIKQKDGNYLTNKKGEIVTVKLNENIKQLSLNTKGGYINYSLDNNDINEIIDDIENKSKKEQFQSKKYKTYTELFYYPLALALFFLFIAFSSMPKLKRSSNKLSLLILFVSFLFISPNKLQAGIFDFLTIKEANEAYKNDDFKTASKNYEKIDSNNERDYNLANSQYKQGNYKEAIKNYENINSEDRDLNFNKLHNLGNSYAKSGNLQKAMENYENALKIKNDKETKENLETVKKAMQKQQKQNSKDSKKNKQKNKKQKQNNKNQENKENKKENLDQKQNSQDKNSKKDGSSKKENKNKQEESQKSEDQNKDSKTAKDAKKIDLKNMSDKEEQRWLKQLKHQKTNSLLKKVESSKESDSTSNPW